MAAVLAGLTLAGCATAPESRAPQPLKPTDAATFFTGRWYEIARTPMSLTDNCMAGTTDFRHRPGGTLIERDECAIGSPAGRHKVFQGPIDILNPGQNNKFTVHYTLYYVVPVAVTYWVLDHDAGYTWFLVSSPSFSNVAILSRQQFPPAREVADLTAELQRLGYDTKTLEFPKQ